MQSPGFIPNLKKIRFELSSVIHLYRYGIPDTTQYSQSTTRSYGIHTLDNQTISNSESSFSSNFPFSFGETQCCSRFSVLLNRLHLRPLQMCLLSVWDLVYLLWIIKFQSWEWSNFIRTGGWIPFASFREHTFILQMPMHSFLMMPAIMDGVLISNRWDYPFMVAGQKTNLSSTSIF